MKKVPNTRGIPEPCTIRWLPLPVKEMKAKAGTWQSMTAAVPAAQPALKGIAQQLASQLAQEQGKTRFLKAHEELRRLQVKLSRL